ncbi:MAG TPA: TIR domain-containing protein [Mycobacteriales bacterium]|nr:TIR domain-containing protein [Mycobacteriales bacterium]
MARKVFFSFRYKWDSKRVQQIKQIGSIEGQTLLSSNEWEKVKSGGDAQIQRWIDGEMKGKNCQVVLIGEFTAGRKWVNYEIKKAWADGKGVLGIHIHNLKDLDGSQMNKGKNPFDDFTINGKKMSSIVKTYDPPFTTSTNVYGHIKTNIESWIEEAIRIRNDYNK